MGPFRTSVSTRRRIILAMSMHLMQKQFTWLWFTNKPIEVGHQFKRYTLSHFWHTYTVISDFPQQNLKWNIIRKTIHACTLFDWYKNILWTCSISIAWHNDDDNNNNSAVKTQCAVNWAEKVSLVTDQKKILTAWRHRAFSLQTSSRECLLFAENVRRKTKCHLLRLAEFRSRRKHVSVLL